MAKPVACQALLSDSSDSPLLHQPVALFQFLRQLLHQLPLVLLQHPCQDSGCELLAFHTRYGEDFAQIVVQPGEAFLEHALHPGRQRLPVKCRSRDPVPITILHQISPRLHFPQYLDGEQGVPGGVLEQGVPKAFVQMIWFGVQPGIDKMPGLRVVNRSQVYADVTVPAFELTQCLCQWMTLLFSRNGILWRGPQMARYQLFRAVCTGDQDPAFAQSPAKVEQQAGGSGVHPLQVIQDEQQRMCFCDVVQHVGDLLEEARLLRLVCLARVVQNMLFQFVQPRSTVRYGYSRALQQCVTWQKGWDQLGTAPQQSLDRERDSLPESQRMLATDGARAPVVIQVTGQHGQDILERQIGIAHARIGTATAAAQEETGMGIHRPTREVT